MSRRDSAALRTLLSDVGQACGLSSPKDFLVIPNAMRNRRIVCCAVILLTLLIVAGVSGVVFGQGGTGKLPPNPRVSPPIRKMPLPRRNIPVARPSPSPSPSSSASSSASCSAQSPKRATGTHTLNLSGGVRLEMVEIPAGNFCMGSDGGSGDEKPVHLVTIRQSFYMGKYEVTQAQWQAVMGNNPSGFKDCGGNCPVEQVSWDDAQNFINKLNASNDGFRYRLPTEAEWEYACRAGTTGDYAGNLSEMAWYSENSGNKTHAVGGKQPNAWGLGDMHGNVWEWCQDWYHETYYGAPSDGSAWVSGGEQKYRVLRGGSWNHVATFLRSANRSRDSPDSRYFGNGFRVVAVR
jgi:formylglycine-generating enzyme required for sulfatase activity